MPSLVSSTAKERLHIFDYDPLLSIYPFLPDHPCAFTCVGTPGGSEPADKSAVLCENIRC